MWTNEMQNLLEPLFQPITDATGEVYAYEALLRFKGEPGNSPLASVKRWEKTGFIRVVDLAMLDCIGQALQASKLRPRLAVNVSIATIESAGPGYLAELQRLAGSARRLVIELTETAPVRDASALLRFASACRANGFLIALDDCAPGHPYGTAAFLGNLRPELVKIDGPFLQESFRTGHIAPLRELIDTAHKFKANVIAEHISSQELRDFALYLGVNLLQGYAVGMPAPLPTRKEAPNLIDSITQNI